MFGFVALPALTVRGGQKLREQMESKILFLFFFIVIMNKHLQNLLFLSFMFFLLLFLKDKDSQCIRFSLF